MGAQMNRRDWMKLFAAGVAGAMVLDPEKLLWVPGEKTIFLPPTTALAEESVVYSIWQLGLRMADHNEFSTRKLMGDNFTHEWQEILRTKDGRVYESKVEQLRAQPHVAFGPTFLGNDALATKGVIVDGRRHVIDLYGPIIHGKEG